MQKENLLEEAINAIKRKVSRRLKFQTFTLATCSLTSRMAVAPNFISLLWSVRLWIIPNKNSAFLYQVNRLSR